MSAAQPLPTKSSNSAGRRRDFIHCPPDNRRKNDEPGANYLRFATKRATAQSRRPRVTSDWLRAGRNGWRLRLLQVLAHQLGHREHVDGRLATEHRFEIGVGVDHPLVLLVLQAVLLDVRPQFLR